MGVSARWVKFFFWLYLLFLIVADGTVTNPADPDLWHRLALGEALAQTGHFPDGDVFSYLSDYTHIADHEWGSALIFYGLYREFGLNVFVVVKLVTLAITLILVVRAGLQDRRPSLFLAAFYALILLVLLPSFQSTVRCMTFTHIFLALWLCWFQSERRGRTIPAWWYGLSMVFWANLHGGFAIGLVWLFLVGAIEFVCGNAWRPWAVRLGVCSLVSLINPFGWQLWVSTVRALTTPRHGFGEWAVVSWWHEPNSYLAYKILLLGLIVAFAILLRNQGWRRIDHTGLLLLGVFVVISLTSGRQTSLFALVAGALVPSYFPRDPNFDEDFHPLRRLGLMGLRSTAVIVPFFMALFFLPGAGLMLEYPSVSSPVGAVQFLQQKKVEGNLLVPFNYGSYALWHLRGQMRVSMDGRYDLVYKPATYQRVCNFFEGRKDWAGLLTDPLPDRRPNAILMPVSADVFRKMKERTDWREVWHDPTDAVFLPVGK